MKVLKFVGREGTFNPVSRLCETPAAWVSRQVCGVDISLIRANAVASIQKHSQCVKIEVCASHER